jgi:hypothetical protein
MLSKPAPDRGSLWPALALAVLASAIIVWLRLEPRVWNFASVGALALFSGARLRSWNAVLLPLGLMAATDFVLSLLKPENTFMHHNTPIVYGTYFLIFALGHWFGRTENPWRLLGLTCGASAAFFLITNFGSWLNVAVLHTVVPVPGMDDYPADLAGLLLCYERALPFYRGTLAGDLVFSLGLFGSCALATRWLAPATQAQEARS